MPATEVVFFRDDDGSAPALEAIRQLYREGQKRAVAKLYVRISRLAERGHELRRPEADYLRDDIHELRVRYGRVNYRLLYFFHLRGVAVISHLITKEGKVPDVEIERAVRARQKFVADPEKHTYRE